MDSGQQGLEHPPPPPGEPPPPAPPPGLSSTDSAAKQVGAEGITFTGHDPARVVIKNTFLDLDGESDDDGVDLGSMKINHRKSDSCVPYGKRRSSDTPQAADASQAPTYPDPEPAEEAPTKQNVRRVSMDSAMGDAPIKQNSRFSVCSEVTLDHESDDDDVPIRQSSGKRFSMESDAPSRHNSQRFSLCSVETADYEDAYAPYNGGSSSGMMNPENPMMPRHDQQMGGYRHGVGEAGSRTVPHIDPFMEMGYGAVRPPHGMPNPYGQPWWPYMPPYMPPPHFMAAQPPPFMPPMPTYSPMPNFEQPLPPPSGKGGGKGGGKSGGKAGGHTRTTIMLRNLPPEYTRDMMIELLDKEGFGGLYDFVYMPMNLRTKESFGYVFVDLVSPVVADQCRSRFQGFGKWSIQSDKVCDVLWSDEQQGLSANIERYRNSPVMHESVPEDCKPVVFSNGYRMPFPPATKRLREPRIRRAVPKEEKEDETQ